MYWDEHEPDYDSQPQQKPARFQAASKPINNWRSGGHDPVSNNCSNKADMTKAQRDNGQQQPSSAGTQSPKVYNSRFSKAGVRAW